MKRSLGSSLALCLCFVSFSAIPAAARGGREKGGIKSFQLKSGFVHDTFVIDVSLPDGYDSSQDRYPVIYLTDGYWRRDQHKRIHEMAAKEGVKEMIVVGIGYPAGYDPNQVRIRDLVYGASNTLSFLVKELIPWVDSNYRTLDDERTLWGSSFGGYFAMYTLFNSADEAKGVFTHFIAASAPTNQFTPIGDKVFYLLDYEAMMSKKIRSLKADLYLSVGGSETDAFKGAFQSITETLEKRKYAGFVLKSSVYPGLDHNTVWEPALFDGIRLFMKR